MTENIETMVFNLDRLMSDMLRKAPEGIVYTMLMLIPIGKVVSYSDIASVARLNPRKVAAILRKNHLPIIVPCHRVVRKDGALAGYSFGGADTKRKLLELEGVRVRGYKVSKEYFYSSFFQLLLR